MLNKEAITSLESQLSQINSQIKISGVVKKRSLWELSDKYLQKTGDYSTDAQQGYLANKSGDKTKIANPEIPICFINKETAHAYLAGTFLSGYPIFAAVSSRQNEEAASMLTSLIGRDQQRMQWSSNLLRLLDDTLRYNVGAAEVLWVNKRGSGVSTKVTAGSTTSGVVNPVVYSGNQITRISPYNLILDPNVEPGKVHSDGTYAGYVEALDYIQLKRKYLEWVDTFIVKQNIGKIFSNSKNSQPNQMGAYEQYTNMYYEPQISKDPTATLGKDNFTHYFGFNPSIRMATGTSGLYEVVTLYKRIIPREYKMAVPNSGNPQVYKLIWINGYLAYCEPISAGHEYLPIVVAQLYPGNIDVKSFVEYITDLQDLATSLMAASLSSMRRAVGDRAIYDPTRIRKADIEATSPVSKIPVSCNAYQQGLESAYKQIPYIDNITGNFQNLMSVAISLSDKTTGLNGSSQGSFIPGNKTVKEFDTIMSNSAARLQLGAVHLDGNFFTPVKEILKLNYLVYAQSESVTDQQNDKTVDIDPAMLREVAPDFKMADGLMPATKQASTDVLMSALAAIQNNPQMSMEYDTAGIVVSILRQSGLTDIAAYKRTPEQLQQFLTQQQAMTQAQNPQPQLPPPQPQ